MDSRSPNLSDHDFIGSCHCTLAQIVTAAGPGGAHQMNLENAGEGRMSGNGTLFVASEELSSSKDDIELQFSAKSVVLVSHRFKKYILK